MGQATDGGDAVNYYERHLGDYARDTSHLSLLEHGVYTVLLDRIYAIEAGIPKDQVQRIARARTKDEIAALGRVLAEFFVLEDGVYINRRAMQEISEFHESEPEREAKRAGNKERKRRNREARKALFDALRDHGIVPEFDASNAELRAMLSRVTECGGHAVVTQGVTRDGTATQTPDTRHQIKAKQKHDPPIGGLSPASPDGSPATPAGGAPEEPQGLASPEAPAKPPPCPQAEIIAAYHAALPECPPVRVWTERAATMLRTRWREDPQRWNLDWWREFFAYIRKCPFLLGQKSDFQASLGWLVRPENFAKVLNGNYEARA